MAPRTPIRLFLTILGLAALGIVGSAVVGILSGARWASGFGLSFVGIGLLVLVGLVYALFGLAWFEIARLNGLYDFGLPAAALAGGRRPGFGGWLLSLWRQAYNGRMWRALANFAIACALGSLVLRLMSWFGWSAVANASRRCSRPARSTWGGARYPAPGRRSSAAPPAPVAGIVGIIGVALLHRVISRGIVATPDRNLDLSEKVRTSTAQRAGAVRAAGVERTTSSATCTTGSSPGWCRWG